MKYIDLKLVKQQCIVDEAFHDDDEYLTHLSEVAQSLVEKEIDSTFDIEAASNNGKLPTPLLHAALLITDYLYAQRGSNDSNPDIPTAYMHLCQLYRNWGSTR